MDLELRDKVVWVTGASEGLGAATARALAAAGAKLALCARGAEKLEALAASLRSRGAEVLALPTDVSQPKALERFASEALCRFGRLDALVNNAGTAAGVAFESLDDAAWQADLDLKLFAAVRLIRAALPAFRSSGGGAIVNMLALAAKAPGAKSAPSSVSRAAGMALTKALSKELGPDNIRVNAILIGIVESAQWERKASAQQKPVSAVYGELAAQLGIPLGRVGRAEELGDLVAFLVSPRAAYVSGAAINFDGGLSPVV